MEPALEQECGGLLVGQVYASRARTRLSPPFERGIWHNKPGILTKYRILPIRPL